MKQFVMLAEDWQVDAMCPFHGAYGAQVSTELGLVYVCPGWNTADGGLMPPGAAAHRFAWVAAEAAAGAWPMRP